MMGQSNRSESLFYYFKLEDHIPEHHLLRLIDRTIDLGFIRAKMETFYSRTGRPSIDPEVLLRMMLIGYLYGITSERRLVEEVKMHLAYRWFTGLGFDQEIPDHSTFSKNRHGRFKEAGLFRDLFQEIVQRCIKEGLVEGKNLSVDGTLVAADASRYSRIPREQLAEAAKVSQTVKEYLEELENKNPVIDEEVETPPSRTKEQNTVSTTDPDATWAVKHGQSSMAYFDNYLIDNKSRVILGAEATPALFSQEVVAAKHLVEQVESLGLHPESLGADKAYGSGAFLDWLFKKNIKPHIPVIERAHQTHGHFMKEQFSYDKEQDVFYCPQRLPLRFRGLNRQSQMRVYSSTPKQCQGCPKKKLCTPGAYRKLVVHWHEGAREKARALVGTEEYALSRRMRYRIESLFAELKHQLGLRKVRLRRLWNVSEQFLMAAAVQNIKRLIKYMAQQPLKPLLNTT